MTPRVTAYFGVWGSSRGTMAGYAALTVSALRSRHLVAGMVFVGLVAAVFVGSVGLGVQAQSFVLSGASSALGVHSGEAALGFTEYYAPSNLSGGGVCVAVASSPAALQLTGRNLTPGQAVIGQGVAGSAPPPSAVVLGSSVYAVASVRSLEPPLDACVVVTSPPRGGHPVGEGRVYVGGAMPTGFVSHIVASLDALVDSWRLLGYAAVAAASAFTGMGFMWDWCADAASSLELGCSKRRVTLSAVFAVALATLMVYAVAWAAAVVLQNASVGMVDYVLGPTPLYSSFNASAAAYLSGLSVTSFTFSAAGALGVFAFRVRTPRGGG